MITPTVTGTLGNNGWYVDDVTITWDAHDGESSVAAAGAARGHLSAQAGALRPGPPAPGACRCAGRA